VSATSQRAEHHVAERYACPCSRPRAVIAQPCCLVHLRDGTREFEAARIWCSGEKPCSCWSGGRGGEGMGGEVCARKWRGPISPGAMPERLCPAHGENERSPRFDEQEGSEAMRHRHMPAPPSFHPPCFHGAMPCRPSCFVYTTFRVHPPAYQSRPSAGERLPARRSALRPPLRTASQAAVEVRYVSQSAVYVHPSI